MTAPAATMYAVLMGRAFEGRDGALRMHLRGMRCLGLRCPRWLLPRVRAIETGEGRRLHFDVHGELPLIGVVAAYRGHLDLSSARPWS